MCDRFITLLRIWVRRHTWHGVRNGTELDTDLSNLQMICITHKELQPERSRVRWRSEKRRDPDRLGFFSC